MPARKSDAEKGPLVAWAYHTRDLLGASPEDSAAAAGISYGTLRKIEGGSNRTPAKRTIYALWQHYRRLGSEAHPPIPVEDPPPEWRGVVAAPGWSAGPAASEVAAAIREQTRVIERQADAIEQLLAWLRGQQLRPDPAMVAAAQEWASSADAQSPSQRSPRSADVGPR